MAPVEVYRGQPPVRVQNVCAPALFSMGARATSQWAINGTGCAIPARANPASQSPQEQLATTLRMPKQTHQPYIGHFRAYFCEAYYYVKP